MHFWGGLLIGLGVHSFATFKLIQIRPKLSLVLAVIFVVAVSWEVFEWFAGLYDPTTYLVDTSKDLVFGFSGGLFTHFVLNNRYNKQI